MHAFTVSDLQLFHPFQLLLTVHMCLFVPHLIMKLYLGAEKSLSMQVVCNPWNQLADVEAKYSESCRDSLSEYKMILHSFMNTATFKVVSFKVIIFSLSVSKINCSMFLLCLQGIIPKSGTEAFYRYLEKSGHHTRATQNPTH